MTFTFHNSNLYIHLQWYFAVVCEMENIKDMPSEKRLHHRWTEFTEDTREWRISHAKDTMSITHIHIQLEFWLLIIFQCVTNIHMLKKSVLLFIFENVCLNWEKQSSQPVHTKTGVMVGWTEAFYFFFKERFLRM